LNGRVQKNIFSVQGRFSSNSAKILSKSSDGLQEFSHQELRFSGFNKYRRASKIKNSLNIDFGRFIVGDIISFYLFYPPEKPGV